MRALCWLRRYAVFVFFLLMVGGAIFLPQDRQSRTADDASTAPAAAHVQGPGLDLAAERG